MKDAQKILERIMHRQLYKLIGEAKVTNIKNDLPAAQYHLRIF